MTNFANGRAAEKAAANYLLEQGYEILEQNWRTRWCEIDIVARHGTRVYLVEVKYRLTTSQGTGFDYITQKKLQQMNFAARFWVQAHNWSGDYSLSAIEVSGPTYTISNFLSELL